MSGDDGLLAALERTIHAGVVSQWHGTMRDDVALTDPRPIVRDLLALPEVAALRAKADAADRVRELADLNPGSQWSKSVVRALDGDQP